MLNIGSWNDKKEIDKAVSDIKLTPFQIELTMKNLAEKSKTITEFLDEILTGKDVELTVKELYMVKTRMVSMFIQSAYIEPSLIPKRDKVSMLVIVLSIAFTQIAKDV